jgi:thymidylate kinase
MTIEFAGLPGSGKSTLNARLIGPLRRMGFEVFSPTLTITRMPAPLRIVVKACYSARLLMRHPGWWIATVAAGCRSRQPTPIQTIELNLNSTYIGSVLDRFAAFADRRAVALLDQGGVQAVASLLMLAGNGKAALAVLRIPWFRKTDACLLLQLPPRVASARLAGRPGRFSRAEDASPEVQLSRLQKVDADLKAVLSAASELLRTSVVAADLAQVEQAVLALLAPLMRLR